MDKMHDAFALCNEFLNTKDNDPGAEVWFVAFPHTLEQEFFGYAYYKYREIKYKEGLCKKYRGMAELYREICLSHDVCAEARERRQNACFPGPATETHVNDETQVREPTAREMRAAGRV